MGFASHGCLNRANPAVGCACAGGCCSLSRRFGTPSLARGKAGAGVHMCTPPVRQSKCNIDISVLAEDKWHWSIYSQG